MANNNEEQAETFLKGVSEKSESNSKKCLTRKRKKLLIVIGIIFGLFIAILAACLILLFGKIGSNPIEFMEIEFDFNATQSNSTMTTIINNETIKNEIDEYLNIRTTLQIITSASQSRLIGKWNSIKSENMEEYMKAVGIDAFRRKFAGLGRASETISKNGEIWTLIGQLHLPIPIKVISEIKLKEEEEVEFDTNYGLKITSLIRLVGPDKMVQEERDFKTRKITSIIIREVNSSGQLITTLKAGKVSATQTYERVI